MLLFLPQLTLWPTAVSWTPPPPASSIKDNAQSGASLNFSVGSIYNSTHTAFCLLLKTQVPQACHRYRPLDVSRASALTVPITCTRQCHVPEVTFPRNPPHMQLLHRRHQHLLDFQHSMIPPCQCKTDSISVNARGPSTIQLSHQVF